MTYILQIKERFKMREDLLSEAKELRSNITDQMLSINMSNLNNTSGFEKSNSFINKAFDEYGEKMSHYVNTTDEVEWNELTSNEFVISIQTTIGNRDI